MLGNLGNLLINNPEIYRTRAIITRSRFETALHTQSIVCATVYGQCLEYLGSIYNFVVSLHLLCLLKNSPGQDDIAHKESNSLHSFS